MADLHLVEINQDQKDKYNQFVTASPTGSFLQSWEWGQWQESLGKKACRFFLYEEHGNVAAALQALKSPLPTGKFYLYIPYGPVVKDNFQFSIFNFQFLLQELLKKFPGAVFIRVEPKANIEGLPLIGKKSTNIQPSKTLIIDLQKTEEQLLAEMHPKTRYNIKVAQRHEVEIKDEFAISVGHGLFFDEALKLITQTSKRQKFATFLPGYYKNMADHFALGNSGEVKLHIYKAIFQNQLLAAAIIMDFGKTRTFLFGGSSESSKNVMAPYLLHWQAMTDARAQGFGIYDFWGIETSAGETPGFVRFKLGFGGRETEYSGVYDVVQKDFKYQAYKIIRALNKLRKKIHR